MRLFIPTTATSLSEAAAVAALRAEGYGHLCAVGTPEHLARLSEPPLTWGLYLQDAHVNLASDDRSRWEYSLAQARQTITVAADHGAAWVALSPGYAVYGGLNAQGERDSDPVKRPGARLRLLRALDLLANHADNRSVAVSLRLQAPLGQEELLTTPEEGHDLIGAIGAPGLRLGLDLGHLKITARQSKRDPDDLVAQTLPLASLVWLHGNEGAHDGHARPKPASWEVTQLDRPEIKALPLIYDARRQPLAEIRAVAGWLSESLGYTL